MIKIKHLLLFGGQTAVGEDGVFESMLISLWGTTAILGRSGLAMVSEPAVEVLFVGIARAHLEFLPVVAFSLF